MRPRKTDRHLPACVYHRHGAYWYVKRGKWTRLHAELGPALHEYARLVAQPTEGVPALIQKALPSLIEGKADVTRSQYIRTARELALVFAEYRPEQVRHGDIVQMLDAYSATPGLANRMLTVLRLAYRWGLDRELVASDPTITVKRLRQQSRDRLLSAGEFTAIYNQAPGWLQCVMDLCYFTGQRIGDVLKIQRSDLLDRGINFVQQKTGKRLIVGWTEELRAVVERCKRDDPGAASLTYLIATRNGTPRAHKNVWKAFKVAARSAGIENATLHDIRAMSGTEADQQGIDPQLLLGHSDRRTTAIYLRDRSAKVVAGPKRANKFHK